MISQDFQNALLPNTATAEERYNALLDCRLVAAEALGCRAITQLMLGMWVRGPYNLRSAWVAYSTLLKESQERLNSVHREILDGIRYGYDPSDCCQLAF
jgi:hypothetical protein